MMKILRDTPCTAGENALHMLPSSTDTICNSFIITTMNGGLIVIDGGFRSETPFFLQSLKRISGERRPHIDAWFLSHPHDDHVSVPFDVIENHGDEVEIGTVYFNFPSRGYLADGDLSAAGTMDWFYRVLPLFADRARIASEGDVIDVRNATFRVLHSQNCAVKVNRPNNCSLVFRMDLCGTSVMFTGDCGVEGGKEVLDRYSGSGLLKCDICQMAHHGQNGCDRDFYEAVSPGICLWPTPTWVWSNFDGTGNLKTLEVRRWIEEMGIKQNLVSKDGPVCIYL
ncbi:MAG: MBL fold metallo-hydrolase [Clostridia bacterium]|nr:MBL fold metallo-hydrolase [Clostridia bacterium]